MFTAPRFASLVAVLALAGSSLVLLRPHVERVASDRVRAPLVNNAAIAQPATTMGPAPDHARSMGQARSTASPDVAARQRLIADYRRFAGRLMAVVQNCSHDLTGVLADDLVRLQQDDGTPSAMLADMRVLGRDGGKTRADCARAAIMLTHVPVPASLGVYQLERARSDLIAAAEAGRAWGDLLVRLARNQQGVLDGTQQFDPSLDMDGKSTGWKATYYLHRASAALAAAAARLGISAP